MVERFSSLGTYKTRERRRLLDFACLRNALVAWVVLGLAALRLAFDWPWWSIVTLAPCDGVLAALVSADWIEHALKRRVLGTDYNPNIMAMGELEGSMTPMAEEYVARWEQVKHTPVAFWHGDPGGGEYEHRRD